MKTFCLNYLDKRIEASYKASAMQMSYKFFVPIMCLVFFDIGAYAFPGMTETSNSKMIVIVTSGLLIILAILGIFLRKYIRILRYYCVGILLVYMIILIEVLRLQQLSFASFYNVHIISVIEAMISINFGMNCIIYFNFSWLFFFGYNIFLYSYILIRLFQHDDWEPENYLKFLLIATVNGFTSFYIEKTTRKNYLDLYNSNEFSKTFQHLIDEVLPTPIIIRRIKDNSIVFYNQAIVQTLKAKSDRKSEEKIEIEESERIKAIINEKMKIMQITLEKEGLNESLLNILNNFEEELLREQSMGCSNNFLHKKIFMSALNSGSFRPGSFKDQNLNLHNLKDEEEKHFDVKIQKMIWQNDECLMIILNDITSIISLSKFKDIDIYKNRLLATVSHDLRTPINGMLGMIETVANDIIDKKDKKLLKMAVKFGHLLLCMINDILDFSKISNLQLSLNMEQINIIALIKDVCNLIKFQIKNKRIEFAFEKLNFSEDALYISTDPNRLKQILLNLLSNSLKFTFKGQIKVILELTMQGILRISVKDTGIGIKKDNIPKLFTLFGKLQQEDPSINKQGVGLGLVISQNLSRLLYRGKENGIHVESVWNEGTVFWFYIASLQRAIENEDIVTINDKKNAIYNFQINSMRDVNKPKKLSEISYQESPEFNESTSLINQEKKILIVDDDQINLLVAKEYMKYFHLDYMIANNGEEAMNIVYQRVVIENKNIDAILMDCNMPIMDGFVATQKIKEILKNSNKEIIPIIALTANVSSVDIEFCFQSGMNYYLAKPVGRRDLAKTLGLILKIELPC